MVVPFKAPIGDVLCVLQYKLQVGLTHSTIKVYLASISARHLGYGDKTMCGHPLMITFMKGVKRAKMTSRPLSTSWDLAVVLGALCKPLIVRALRLYRQKTLIDYRSLVAQSSLSC